MTITTNSRRLAMHAILTAPVMGLVLAALVTLL